jgi:hypothetical protein
MREIIGWGSAFILLPTFGLQAYKQWQARHEHAPASTLWFFILALVGVAGQVAYSWMLGNWVYFVLNACLVVTNTLGLALALHRRGVGGPHPGPVAANDGVARHEAPRSGHARPPEHAPGTPAGPATSARNRPDP